MKPSESKKTEVIAMAKALVKNGYGTTLGQKDAGNVLESFRWYLAREAEPSKLTETKKDSVESVFGLDMQSTKVDKPIIPPNPTIDSKLRKLIVKHTSEMLDNPNEYEIYPTGKFYNDLEADLIQLIAREVLEGRIETAESLIELKEFYPSNLGGDDSAYEAIPLYLVKKELATLQSKKEQL